MTPTLSLGRIRTALGKPPGVVAFRGAQELRLLAMRRLGRWERLARDIERHWSPERATAWALSSRDRPGLVAGDAARALKEAFASGELDGAALVAHGRRRRDRRFSLLGAPLPEDGPLPWHADWRFGKTWEKAHFQDYDFYGPRDRPWDVKLPWELSRLAWLLPILQAGALEPEGGFDQAALAVAADWERSNPLARSVNWYPMEASMRAVSLALALEMLLATGRVGVGELLPLLRLLSAHGEFVFRTIEYSDVRGNHYAANLVALLLAGGALHGSYPPAGRWLEHAARALPGEIEVQLLEDGVDFEKSLPYHRLVTELFLLALLAMERRGSRVPATARERVRAACLYAATCTRPDGLTPNVGDGDDGHVLSLDPLHARDHRALLGVASAFFSDPLLKPSGASPPAALPWLLGTAGLARWRSLPRQEPGSRFFAAGGVVVARAAGHFFWMDVGEVGLAGRGGHGHNDLLSFELWLNGTPVVLDPGGYVYTADPEARDLFRSTAYHNSARVDGVEIAAMPAMWRIANDATPRDVEVDVAETHVRVRAGHDGYRRLPRPVSHTRETRFDAAQGTLRCEDRFHGEGAHRVERFLHLVPGANVSLADGRAEVAVAGSSWAIRWNGGTRARVEAGWISPSYAVREGAAVLVLANEFEGAADLWVSISANEVTP